MSYIVTIDPSRDGISAKPHLNQSFTDYQKAQEYFNTLCDSYNIDSGEWSETEADLKAGGEDFNYVIELIVSKFE